MTAHILVVDDEPDIEALVLQKFRHKIRGGAISFLFARDGVEALAALKANGQIDLVVTDINMPRMDGLSLLQKLQENEKQVSTIIVSAYGDMSNIRTAMNRGAFDFVTKPIDFQDLETTIAKTVRHIELLRDARQRQAVAERAYASLSRYFSPNLVQELACDTDAIVLVGQRREIATLFTDIASFTALVETLEPSVLGPLLNEYLTGMTDIVFAMTAPWRRSSAMRCTCCLEPQASSPTMPLARLPAHWLLTSTPRRSAHAVIKRALHWVSRASASMPDRRSSAILVAGASSTTQPMATPSTLRRDWKLPTSNSARAYAPAQRSRRGWKSSEADRSGTLF
jgi:CheY-like chemotaxis protein